MYTIKVYKNKSYIDGYGLFAGEFVPKGTIVYFCSSNEKRLSKKEFEQLPGEKRELYYRFGVEDEEGSWFLSDGDANHSCDANILSLFVDSLYCDIAVKDINVGNEITIDYGLFYSSIPWTMACNCGSPLCRNTIVNGPSLDADAQKLWFSRISDAASRIFDVEQNMFSLDDDHARALTASIKSKISPKILPYIKFSLISSSSQFYMGKLE